MEAKASQVIPVKNIDTIYIRESKGPLQRARRSINWLLCLAFFLLPWVPWGDRQGVLLAIEEQKFYFFSTTLWPQDFTLLAWFLIFAAFALFLITSLYGRLWCGFVCPQTVWTLFYVWIERKIEGNSAQREKLDRGPWTLRKVGKKSLKHLLWFLAASLTGITFIAYFIPAKELFPDVLTFTTTTWVGFWVWFFAIITYLNAGFMREKMCLHCCPYARFQSAMFDNDTKTISYNPTRGESRGPRKRKQDHKALGLGDCVDCKLCVDVCPTGIDIRDGLQYECIDCGACADVCDQTMSKFGYDKGLILFASENSLRGETTPRARSKVIGYSVVTALFMVLVGFQAFHLTPMEFNVIRDRNELYRYNQDGWVENSYTVKILNKTQQDQDYQIHISGNPSLQIAANSKISVRAGEMVNTPITLMADPEELATKMTQFSLTATSQNHSADQATQKSSFFSEG